MTRLKFAAALGLVLALSACNPFSLAIGATTTVADVII